MFGPTIDIKGISSLQVPERAGCCEGVVLTANGMTQLEGLGVEV